MLEKREYRILQMNDGIFEMNKDLKDPSQVEYYIYDAYHKRVGKKYLRKEYADFEDGSSLIKEGIAVQWETVLERYGISDKKICKIFHYGDYIIEMQEDIENPSYIDFYFSNPNYAIKIYMFQKIIDFNSDSSLESSLTSIELEKRKKVYQERYENEGNLKTTKDNKIWKRRISH